MSKLLPLRSCNSKLNVGLIISNCLPFHADYGIRIAEVQKPRRKRPLD